MNKFQQFTKLTKENITKEFAQKNIPIPIPSYLTEVSHNKRETSEKDKPFIKYGTQYEAFCKWAALPGEIREPKTQKEFEERFDLPEGYITEFFKTRNDFPQKRLTYFWEWMADVFPDVVYSVYKRAMRNSSKDASIFIDLLAKQLNITRPTVNVTPMVLVGVSQDKLDKMFVPQGYEDDKLPKLIPQQAVGKGG